MIIKTKGYVFRTLKYGEHQLITDIFTESNGLLSFIVPGARKGGIHSKGIFLQPLSSLDLIIEVQDGKNLQKIKEIKFDRLFTNIQLTFWSRYVGRYLCTCVHLTTRTIFSNPSSKLRYA